LEAALHEKHVSVLALWANYDKYESLEDVAKAINVSPETVRTHWIRAATKISPKLKECTASYKLTNEHIYQLLKYPHGVQDKLDDA